MFITAAKYAIIIPCSLLCLLPVINHFRVAPKKLFPVFLSCVTVICLIMVIINTPEKKLPPNLLLFPFFVVFLIGYFMLVKLEKLKLIYVLLCTVAALSFGELANHMVQAIINPVGHSYDYSSYGLLVQWLISLGILLIFLLLLRKKFIWIVDNFHIKSVWSIVWICPAAIALCSFIMVPWNYANMHVGRIVAIYIILDSTLLLLFLMFQIMFYKIAKTTTEKAEANKKAQMLLMQAQQYTSLKNYLEQTRKIRHDFKHIIRTITSLINSNNDEELKSYIEKYNNYNNENHVPFFFCEHTAANALLGYYAELASQYDIKINWKIEIPQQITVNDVDLCVIIGNILENAINGCTTVDSVKRYINLSVDMDDLNELYIVAVNSFDGMTKKQNGKFISTKRDSSGIGIASVTATSEKYGGVAHFYDNGTKFFVEIMLKLPEA